MKKILLVIAHPREDSFCFAMANTYKNEKEKLGNRVEILDLYRDKNKQEFFNFKDANRVSTPQMKYYQNKIKDSDELVFMFPYWWGSYPAILHNFFDWNLSRGFAFEYIKPRPKGLLENKKVSIFTTTGAPSFVYTITGAKRRLKNTLKEQVINFCGMKLSSFNMYGGVDTFSKNTNGILNNIEKIASLSD